MRVRRSRNSAAKFTLRPSREEGKGGSILVVGHGSLEIMLTKNLGILGILEEFGHGILMCC